MAVSLIDFMNDINYTKANLLRTSDDVDDAKRSYSPYMINRNLSYNLDTVMYAAEMNKCPYLDKQMQYDYLVSSIRSRKRYLVKWGKPENVELVKRVAKVLKCSTEKARNAIDLVGESVVLALIDGGGTGETTKKKKTQKK